MKKFALIALFALLSAPVFAADVTSASDSASVTLIIEKYCYVTLGDDIEMTISGGGASASGSTSIEWGANFAFDLTVVLTPGSVGTWVENFTDIDEGTAGVDSGTITVDVSGITLADLAGTYSGSLEATIFED